MVKFKKNFEWEQIARDNQAPEEIIYVSKSELKRDAARYREIATKIIDLPLTKIHSFGFDSTLLQTIELARTITTNEARRRQISFVAKQLRAIDLEVLEALLRQATPTRFSGAESQLDKRVRVTIERILNPQFREKTLTQLEQQLEGFERATALELLEKHQGDKSTNLIKSALYQYFYDLYRTKLEA